MCSVLVCLSVCRMEMRLLGVVFIWFIVCMIVFRFMFGLNLNMWLLFLFMCMLLDGMIVV